MNLCFLYFDKNKNALNVSFCESSLLNIRKEMLQINQENLGQLNILLAHSYEEETIVLGYNLQDFLAYCIEKYSIRFNFQYFDILRLYRAYYGIKEEPSLEELAYDYQIELEEFNPAKSMFSFLLEDSGCDTDYFLHGFFGDCRLNANAAAKYESLLREERQKKESAINGLLNSEIKGIFVFDFECSNTDRGVGKICELGGIYLDKSLSKMDEVEYLINPEADFHLGSDISLYYSENQYRRAPKLPEQYEKFKNYFEDPCILKIGYAALNDINFLLTDLNRYRKEGPSFICFDVQPLVDKALESDSSVGLGKANLSLLGDLGSNREHRALDDSKLTLRLFRYFLKSDNLKDFLALNRRCFCSSINLIEIKENRLPVLAYW